MLPLSSLRPLIAAILVAVSLLAPAPAAGQVRNVRLEARRATASRDELENVAVEAEQIAVQAQTTPATRREKLAEAQAIRARLTAGDFQAGDRIVLRVTGDPNVKPEDTVIVRAGSTISLGGIGELPLRGVLRSELAAHLRKEIARFVRGATVQVTPVVRLGVFGPVAKPGFYEFSSEMLLSEAIMRTGGPMPLADQHNITLHRGSEETWGRQAVDIALQEGVTVEQLGLRGGDELVVGEKSSITIQSLLQYVSIVLQVVNLYFVLTVSRR